MDGCPVLPPSPIGLKPFPPPSVGWICCSLVSEACRAQIPPLRGLPGLHTLPHPDLLPEPPFSIPCFFSQGWGMEL